MNDLDNERLRRLIQGADPASSLPPLRSDQIIRTTEEIMSRSDTDTTVMATPRRHRRLLAGSLGLLAVASAAAIVIPLATGGNRVTVIEQPQAGGPAAMCSVVTPNSISGAHSAFRGTVTGIADGIVTLTVTDRFVGNLGDTVQTTQGVSAGVDGEPITFENGATYLIAINSDDTILTCGASGPDSPELSTIYSQAFTK